MVHQYKNNGYNIVLDVNSGSVHIVDDVVYDTLELYEDHTFEEIINKFMDKFTEIEDDREKLLENIDLLNDKIKQKNIQINEIEIKLSESQDSIEEYKAKINDIEGLNKSLLQDHSDEIVNLKQIIKQKEDEIKTCNEKVQKLHHKLDLIRTDYINKTIAEIVKTKPSYITIENLNVSGMMKNRHLSKAVASRKFYEFRTKLKVKCDDNGIELRIADRFYPSSKICHC